jgi:hypothetical protein
MLARYGSAADHIGWLGFLVSDSRRSVDARGSGTVAVRRALCKMVLDALVADKFLCVKSDGAYARLTEGVISRPRPVNAALGVEQRIATAS